MGLFDLVEQHHRIGLAPNRFGQLAALAIADIARRCPFQRADGVAFLVFGHVDGDDVLLATIDRLGQCQGGFGLADTGRPAQHEYTDWLVRIVELGAVGLNALGDHLDAVALTDDPLVDDGGKVQDLLHLVGNHAARGDAGPVRDDGRHGLFVHMRIDHALIRVDFVKRAYLALERRADGDRIGSLLAKLGTQVLDLLYDGLLLGPFGLERIELGSKLDKFFLDLDHTRLVRRAKGAIGHQRSQFRVAILDQLAGILDHRRHRNLTDGNPRTGGVDQADSLVRQLPGRDITGRQVGSGDNGLVRHLDAVVLFHHADHAAQHVTAFLDARLVYIDDLKAPGQRWILFEVFLVLHPRRRRDGAQGAACQRRLQQVGRIPGPGSTASADQGVGLVDEHDDRRRARLHLVDDAAQTLLELALHRSPGLQQTDIEAEQARALNRRRHLACHDLLGKPLDHGGFANAGLARDDRVVLAAALKDVDDLTDFLVTSDNRVHLGRLGGHVHAELVQRRCPGRAFARIGPGTANGRAVHRLERFLVAVVPDVVVLARQRIRVDLAELGAEVFQRAGSVSDP